MKLSKKLNTKKEILDFLQNDDKFSNLDALHLLENWTSFISERFTPKRYSGYLLWRSKRYAKLGMEEDTKQLVEIAKHILQSTKSK